MTAKQLLDLVQSFKEHREFITNEETTKMVLVVPFLQMLGYEPNNPREVRLEYSADFTQGDGKRLPDRMDFMIFDPTGQTPQIAVEVKPLGTLLRQKTQQLARYVAQAKGLHFGIITDGCTYLFYGDLGSPNVMDDQPFFDFALCDETTDWQKVAKFLDKFSRTGFNADVLFADAEDSRFRKSMVQKLVLALRDPAADEGFIRWLTEGISSGKRTAAVMERLSKLAQDAMEPAIMQVLSDEWLTKLKLRLSGGDELPGPADSEASKIVTTEEELAFHAFVRDFCATREIPPALIVYRDTVSYFNVSYGKPKNWFVRFVAHDKRKCIITLVPVEEAQSLASSFFVEAMPSNLGVSRAWFDSFEQLDSLKDLIWRSLELVKGGAAAAGEAVVTLKPDSTASI